MSSFLLLQETANIAFKLSDDAYLSHASLQEPPHPGSSPARALADALSHAPALHTLSTRLPALWNPLLLHAARNARLERIMLDPGTPGEGVLPTCAFMREAKKYGRLMDLVRAGT